MSSDLTRVMASFEQRLAKLEAGARTSQLQNASITGTAITVYDEDGETPRQYIGLHGDGTVGTSALNGPVPPAPNTPALTPGQLSLTVSWDGTFVDEDGDAVPRPTDVEGVQVHVSMSSGFTPDATTIRGLLKDASDLVVQPLEVVQRYVVLVAVTSSEVTSAPSTEATATPEQVVATDIVDGIVTTLKLADNAVSEAKLAANAVTETKIADDAVTTPKLIAGAVQTSKIAAGAVDAGTIAAGAVTTGKLDALAVTADKLAAHAVTAEKIEAGAITAESIDATAIDGMTITGATVRTVSSEGGLFVYADEPTLGNLIVSVASAAGTDPHGNEYPQGLNVNEGVISGSEITIEPGDQGMFIYANDTVRTTYSAPGSHTFNVPAGVSSVHVECWGGGGSGGSSGVPAGDGGGGGGGGEYAADLVLAVTPGGSHSLTVGAGSTTSAPGGNSSFTGASFNVVAHGGSSTSNRTGAAGGTGSLNPIHYNGGAGGNGSSTATAGGGGGSSAGIAEVGDPGTAGTGSEGGFGGIAPFGGGWGGDGGWPGEPGLNGDAPGGGGGGTGRNTGGTAGNGANGLVRVTYAGTGRVLAASIAADGGTDQYGNDYPAGIAVFGTGGEAGVLTLQPPDTSGFNWAPAKVYGDVDPNNTGSDYPAMVIESPSQTTGVTESRSSIFMAGPSTELDDNAIIVDTNSFQVFSGGEFHETSIAGNLTVDGGDFIVLDGAGEVQYIVQAADQGRTSNTLIDADDLAFDAAADAIYEVRARLAYNSTTASDFKVAWRGPTGFTMSRNIIAPQIGSASNENTTVAMIRRAASTEQNAGGTGGTTSGFTGWWEDSIVTMGATAGTVHLQFARVAGSDTATLRSGSYMIVTRIA